MAPPFVWGFTAHIVSLGFTAKLALVERGEAAFTARLTSVSFHGVTASGAFPELHVHMTWTDKFAVFDAEEIVAFLGVIFVARAGGDECVFVDIVWIWAVVRRQVYVVG